MSAEYAHKIALAALNREKGIMERSIRKHLSTWFDPVNLLHGNEIPDPVISICTKELWKHPLGLVAFCGTLPSTDRLLKREGYAQAAKNFEAISRALDEAEDIYRGDPAKTIPGIAINDVRDPIIITRSESVEDDIQELPFLRFYNGEGKSHWLFHISEYAAAIRDNRTKFKI